MFIVKYYSNLRQKKKKSFLRVRVVSCWVECRSLALGWVGLIAGLANTLVQLFWPVIS